MKQNIVKNKGKFFFVNSQMEVDSLLFWWNSLWILFPFFIQYVHIEDMIVNITPMTKILNPIICWSVMF
ncbi:hypothetical protein [Mesoplasma corruscae]|uniref:hypothetical protein n=1 Tax=Mesoplasma corruscae TaxID=216874 RepID=UPI0015E1D8BC|nr:hypothetical protein [Mesoplasma corruscae]